MVEPFLKSSIIILHEEIISSRLRFCCCFCSCCFCGGVDGSVDSLIDRSRFRLVNLAPIQILDTEMNVFVNREWSFFVKKIGLLQCMLYAGLCRVFSNWVAFDPPSSSLPLMFSLATRRVMCQKRFFWLK